MASLNKQFDHIQSSSDLNSVDFLMNLASNVSNVAEKELKTEFCLNKNVSDR